MHNNDSLLFLSETNVSWRNQLFLAAKCQKILIKTAMKIVFFILYSNIDKADTKKNKSELHYTCM